VVGALYAWGKHPKKFLAFLNQFFFIGHFTLKSGLIDSESFKEYLQTYLKMLLLAI
jgi:hypothetical protein